jgi:hypothetical protein
MAQFIAGLGSYVNQAVQTFSGLISTGAMDIE